VQTVGVHKGLQKSGSEVYKHWQEQVLKFRGGEPPPYGAIWLTLYPNIMVEWYPHFDLGFHFFQLGGAELHQRRAARIGGHRSFQRQLACLHLRDQLRQFRHRLFKRSGSEGGGGRVGS
jgi:hypothetical protein